MSKFNHSKSWCDDRAEALIIETGMDGLDIWTDNSIGVNLTKEQAREVAAHLLEWAGDCDALHVDENKKLREALRQIRDNGCLNSMIAKEALDD